MNKIGCTFAVVLASYNKNRQPTVFGGSGRKILTLADCRRQVKICPPCVWLTITSEVIDYVVDATNRRSSSSSSSSSSSGNSSSSSSSSSSGSSSSSSAVVVVVVAVVVVVVVVVVIVVVVVVVVAVVVVVVVAVVIVVVVACVSFPGVGGRKCLHWPIGGVKSRLPPPRVWSLPGNFSTMLSTQPLFDERFGVRPKRSPESFNAKQQPVALRATSCVPPLAVACHGDGHYLSGKCEKNKQTNKQTNVKWSEFRYCLGETRYLHRPWEYLSSCRVLYLH